MTPHPDLEATPEAMPKPAPYLLPPGTRPDYYRDPRAKSPVLTTVLSLMPGLGQVYWATPSWASSTPRSSRPSSPS